MLAYMAISFIIAIPLFILIAAKIGLGNDLGSLVVGLILIVVLGTIATVISALIWSELLLEGVRGHKVGFAHGLRPLKKVWIPFVYLLCFIAVVAGGGFLSFLAGSVGGALIIGLLFFVLTIVGIVLAVRWSFAFFAIVDNADSGPRNSLARSSQLTKGHRWMLFVYWLIAIIISFVVSAIGGDLTGSNSNYSANCDFSYSSSNDGTQPLCTSSGQKPSHLANARSITANIVGIVLEIAFYAGFAELYRQIKDGSQPASQEPPASAAPPSNPVPPTNPMPPVMPTAAA